MTIKKNLKKKTLQLATPIIMLVANKIQNWKFAKTFLKYLGNYLVVKNNISNSDIIVILGGGSIQRVRTGVQLYKNGMAHKLLIYRNISKDKFLDSNNGISSTTQEAVHLGIKVKNIIHEDAPRTTAEEAKSLSKTLIRLGFNSAIIISDAYHIRRASILFRHYINTSKLHINFCPTGLETFDPNKWWYKKEDTKNLISEYLALVETFFKLYI